MSIADKQDITRIEIVYASTKETRIFNFKSLQVREDCYQLSRRLEKLLGSKVRRVNARVFHGGYI